MRYTRLHNLAVLSVLGGDRDSFLQGQLTQDLLKVSDAQSLLAGWASPKGRLLCIMQVLRRGDEILAVLPAELVDEVSQRLRLFVLRAEVTIRTAALAVFGLLDLEENAAIEIAGLSLPPGKGSSVSSAELLLARSAGDPGRALALGDADTLEPLLAAAGQTAELESWSRAEIAAGVPVITTAGSESFVPQMVNLDLLGGISFSKGCYVGQEVVARTQNLGRIKRRMFRYALAGAGPVREGDALLDADGGKAGVVVNSAPVDGGWELLAVVALGSRDGGLRTESGAPLTDLPLPYDVPRLAD